MAATDKKELAEIAASAAPVAKASAAKVQFDTRNLKSSYANVCTVTSTREEVVLNFGINQAWERGSPDMAIELTNRIILSPFAAKRMLDLLGKLMREYEVRYGALHTEPVASPPMEKKN